MADSELAFVPTKLSCLKKDAGKSFECVVFESHKKKESQAPKICKVERKAAYTDDAEMKRIRFEVFKFAMAGCTGQEKEDAKVALAVQLGAKLPKNKYINYKELKERKQRDKKEFLAEENVRKAGKAKNFGKFNKSSRRKKDNILKNFGTVNKAQISERKTKSHIRS